MLNYCSIVYISKWAPLSYEFGSMVKKNENIKQSMVLMCGIVDLTCFTGEMT